MDFINNSITIDNKVVLVSDKEITFDYFYDFIRKEIFPIFSEEEKNHIESKMNYENRYIYNLKGKEISMICLRPHFLYGEKPSDFNGL